MGERGRGDAFHPRIDRRGGPRRCHTARGLSLIHIYPKACQRALGLPDAESAIVVLVDGLGFWNLAMRLGHAPYLRSLMNERANQRPIATCAPSTTVAAMAAFGTGTCPGLTAICLLYTSLPWPSTSSRRIANGCAKRTMAS